MNQEKILLVDGMALLFRGFFATSVYGYYMYNDKGIPTNGVNGFMKYFLDAVETFQPTHIICCWDMGSHTFRTRLYPEYKANRPDPPEEIIPQFNMAKEVMAGLGVPNIGMKDFEADDCIGTLSKQLSAKSQVYILTGDQDMLQLTAQNVTVVIMKKGRRNYKLFNETNLFDQKGCTAQQIIDMKGLMGDSSDNYPGVKGIGEKTALKLLREYETIDQLINQLHKLSPSLQKKIETNKEILYLSRKLAEIRTDVPIESSLTEALWEASSEDISTVLGEKGIKVPF